MIWNFYFELKICHTFYDALYIIENRIGKVIRKIEQNTYKSGLYLKVLSNYTCIESVTVQYLDTMWSVLKQWQQK